MNAMFWPICLILSISLLGGDEGRQISFFQDGNKTTVVIQMMAQGYIPYRLNEAEGLFELEIPGSFKDGFFDDIENLNFVESFEMANPGIDQNTSLVLDLEAGTHFEVFDGEPGQLILFFEKESSPEVLKQLPPETSSEPMEPVELPNPDPVSSQNVEPDLGGGEVTITGVSGDKRLDKIRFSNSQGFEYVEIRVYGDFQHRSFYLEQPRRFVLDLKDVIFSLKQNNMDPGSNLISQVRARQFQAEPIPITRVVLDLAENRVVVRTEISENLVRMFVGVSDEELNAALSNFSENPQDSVAANSDPLAITHHIPGDDQLPNEPSDLEPSIDANEESVLNTVASTNDFPGTLEDEKPLVETDVEDPINNDESAIESTLGIPSVVSVQTVSVSSLKGNESAEKTDVPLELVADNEEISKPNIQASVKDEGFQASVKDEDFQASMEDEGDLDVPETKPLSPEIQDEVLARADQAFESEKAAFSDFTAEVKEEDQPMLPDTELAALPFDIEIPNDRDMAQERDLDTGNDSLYQSMRGIRSSHNELSPIFVTNRSIEAAKSNELVEAKSFRTMNYQDGASLFDEMQNENDNYETIGGGETRYKGFKISLIDVKEVDVVDLLRFISEQVGINLFVDYSVSQQNLKATYTFRNIPWDQALDIILKNANLEKQYSNGVLRVATIEKFHAEELARQQLREQQEESVPVETVYFPLNYAKVEEVAPICENYLSRRGRIMQDVRTNTLIIEDIPKRMTSIRNLIQRLDRTIPQVAIESRIVETNKRFLKELGIQWGVSASYQPEMGTQTGVSFPNRVGLGGPTIGDSSQADGAGLLGGYAVDFPAANVTGGGIGLSLGNFLDTFKLDISLQLAENSGEGRIISAPKVTTQNNKTAVIKNGQKVPIQTFSRGVLTIRYIDALLEMEVTPQVTADETIIMDIIVDKSEPDFTRTVSGNPVINIRRAETRVMVKDGGTTVIGGIFTLNTQDANRGIPFLDNIPVVRRLFGSELESMENTELLIFVTPKIVKY